MSHIIKVGGVVFGFGEPAELIPNEIIGANAVALTRAATTYVLFTDRDVEPHLRGTVPIVEIDSTIIPSTYRLALAAIEGAKRHRLAVLFVVAAPCHMWRCLRDLRWAAHDLGVTVRLIPHRIENFEYDSEALTVYTRSPLWWWPAEIAFRILSTLNPAWYKRKSA